MLCTAGANVTNPADAILVALERLGAQMEHQGAPAHPGTLFWLAYVHDVPIFGLPLCGMFSQETVADLILPHLMTGQRVTHQQIAALGHGGLFTGGMAYRFPNYASNAPQPSDSDDMTNDSCYQSAQRKTSVPLQGAREQPR